MCRLLDLITSLRKALLEGTLIHAMPIDHDQVSYQDGALLNGDFSGLRLALLSGGLRYGHRLPFLNTFHARPLLCHITTQLIGHLDLHEVTLIDQSMGCAEIARYLTRHGASRIARVVLISPITPCLLQSEDNPEGVPREVFESHLAAQLNDRPRYNGDAGLSQYLGLESHGPGSEIVSSEMRQWLAQLILEVSPRANVECYRSFWLDDFR